MLNLHTPWNLQEVLAVHVLRLLLGMFLVRMVFPAWFTTGQSLVEITDRVVIIALVWLVIHRHGGKLADWGVTAKKIVHNSAIGLAAGSVLLIFSLFSERVYATVLYLTPSQHPLITQIENAVTWQELIVPILLASLAAPVAEEALYRLLTFTALRERYGLWGGVVISAAIFALFHFNLYWLTEIFMVGVGLALLYHWTGSLVSAIVAHSFVNTAKIAMFFLNIPLT